MPSWGADRMTDPLGSERAQKSAESDWSEICHYGHSWQKQSAACWSQAWQLGERTDPGDGSVFIWACWIDCDGDLCRTEQIDLNTLNCALKHFDSTKEELQVLHIVSDSTSKCNTRSNLAVIAPEGIFWNMVTSIHDYSTFKHFLLWTEASNIRG